MENMKDQRIAAFLTLDDGSGYGCGDGFGFGYGYGDGHGCGSGDGDGTGHGEGYGYGYGYGYGSSLGDGSGYGTGAGCVDGSGDGWWGDGYYDGYGSLRYIKSFCGSRVYMIDDVPTIIDRVAGEIAKGRILRNDMTTTPCFVVKGGGYFAHSDTLRGAMEALRYKQFDGLPEDERIEALIKAHEHGKQYPWLICTSGTTN